MRIDKWFVGALGLLVSTAGSFARTISPNQNGNIFLQYVGSNNAECLLANQDIVKRYQYYYHVRTALEKLTEEIGYIKELKGVEAKFNDTHLQGLEIKHKKCEDMENLESRVNEVSTQFIERDHNIVDTDDRYNHLYDKYQNKPLNCSSDADGKFFVEEESPTLPGECKEVCFKRNRNGNLRLANGRDKTSKPTLCLGEFYFESLNNTTEVQDRS